MAAKIISTEEEIRNINYYKLGKVRSFSNLLPENNEWIEIDVDYHGRKDIPQKFRFRDMKLLRYFVTKLSQANFKRAGMKIKYEMTVIILLCLFSSLIVTGRLHSEEITPVCINEELLTGAEKTPVYNLLSFPAVSTGDPYVVAVSYFNNKINIITRENYVSQYQYSGVPYSVYKTFLNSEEKKDYYMRCIKDNYEVLKVY